MFSAPTNIQLKAVTLILDRVEFREFQSIKF